MVDYSPYIEKQLKGHSKRITAIDFSPNEKQMASCSYDNTVVLWDIRDDEAKNYRYQGHSDAVLDIAFSPSGTFMATASRDKTVRLWVPSIGGSVGSMTAHSGAVEAVQFFPDGSKLLTAGDDGIFKIWSVVQQRIISQYKAHKNKIHCARFSTDGVLIATTAADRKIKLWSADSQETIHTYTTENSIGVHLSWHPTGYLLAVATTKGSVEIYDIRTHSIAQQYIIHDDVVNQLSFHPSGNYIVTASKDNTLKIMNLKKGYRIYTLNGHSSSINAVAFSPSGNEFISGGEDNLLCVWKTNFVTKIDTNTLNQSTASRASSSRQRTSVWKQCYHSVRYPVTVFHNHETVEEKQTDENHMERPTASSTPIRTTTHIATEHHSNEMPRPPTNVTCNSHICATVNNDAACSSDVGDNTHIPRRPPTPLTYTVPSLVTLEKDEFYGMISLKENDVCYTTGTIEWVSKKRNMPVNGGFKLLNDKNIPADGQPFSKKSKRMDTTLKGINKPCECTDVLPTVNAIVDHLNALHEAVDIVDIRLGTLEDCFGKHENQ